MNGGNTNTYEINKANLEVRANRPSQAQRRHLKLFPEMFMDKRAKRARLAGHVIRTERNDPLPQVSYVAAFAIPCPIDNRRGGCRQQWLKYTNKHIWEMFCLGLGGSGFRV